MLDLKTMQYELYTLASSERIESVKRFFKTNKGQYAEADVFLGISIPQLRKLSSKFMDANLEQLQTMLFSKFHEERMLSLLVLVKKFQKSKIHKEKDEIFKFYTNSRNIVQVNNWDLVDTSCRCIIGVYLMDNPLHLNILTKLAQSNNVWQRRISIVSTYEFIRKGEFEFAYKIIKLLLRDNEDIIQKAVGWMLREIGKRDKNSAINFLGLYSADITPKVMRYATENFNSNEKKSLLNKL